MQQDDLIVNNSVKIAGIVLNVPVFSHNLYGEGFYAFKVKVPRLSQSFDELPITVSERLVNLSEIEPNRKISVDGQVRSYNNYIEGEKRNKLVITVFARELIIIDEIENLPKTNEIYLNGFICKKPIYRTTPFGREICDILLASNRYYNKSDYIPCISWGRNAKFAEKLKIGDNIVIGGRLQSRNYQKKVSESEIIEKTAYEISVTKIELYKSKFDKK